MVSFELERERACLPDLHWRVALPSGLEPGALIERLRQLGADDRSPNRLVRLFCLPSGHRVVLVPKTGRIQLRLCTTSVVAERVGLAQALAQSLF